LCTRIHTSDAEAVLEELDHRQDICGQRLVRIKRVERGKGVQRGQKWAIVFEGPACVGGPAQARHEITYEHHPFGQH